MCAVVSCPFWAGWLNKITAHTPALNLQNLDKSWNSFNPVKLLFLSSLRVDKVDYNRVGNYATSMTLGQ